MSLGNIEIIAEVSNSHEGDYNYATELIHRLCQTTCNAVKLQVFTAEEIYHPSHPDFTEFTRLSLGDEQYLSLGNMIKKNNKLLYVDVFGSKSAQVALEMNADGIKIHSTDIINHGLIEFVAGMNKKVFLSTGGCLLFEIVDAITICRTKGNDNIVLVTGTQSYPTSPEETYLGRVSYFKREFRLPVCIADHIDGDNPMNFVAPMVAVGLGAEYIEKHVTINRNRRKDDDHSALNPEELEKFCEQVKILELMLAGSESLEFNTSDISYRSKVIKKPILTNDLEEGKAIKQSDIFFVRTTADSKPITANNLVGRKAVKRLVKGNEVTLGDIEHNVIILLAARLSSSRLPNKVLQKVCNIPAIEFMMQRLKESKTAKVILCTSIMPSDNLISEIAVRNGISVYRGELNDVMKRYIGSADAFAVDTIVRCTGDNLFIDPMMIDEVVQWHFINNNEFTEVIHVPDGADFQVISSSALKKIFRVSVDTSKSEYLTWFIRRAELLNIDTWYPHKKNYEHIRLTLDTKTDYEIIKHVLLELKDIHFSYEQLIDLIEKKPQLFKYRDKDKLLKEKMRVSDLEVTIDHSYDLTKL